MLARLTSLGTLLGTLAVTFAVGCGSGNGDGTDAQGGGDGAKRVDAMVDAADTATAVIPLTSLGALSYTAPLSYGSQMFNVIVDTGSSTTGIAGSTCTTCQVTSKYTPGSAAVDEHSTVMSAYGDGSMWTGEVYLDTTTLGTGPDAKIKFASITTDTGFFNRGGGYDGIMGFGPDTALLPDTTSYITSAIALGLNPVMAFQLCPDSGSLWLGGYDPSATAAAPIYSNLVQGPPFNEYDAVGVGGASMGGSDLGIASADFGPTIIDTGTSISFVPAAVLSKIETGVTSSAGFTTVFGAQSLDSQDGVSTAMTSAQIDAMLPPFGLTFPSSTDTVSIPATKSYLTYEGSQNGMNYYAFAFEDSSQLFGSSVKVSLFGDTLLAGMVAVFDLGQKQIGFAPQKGCTEAAVERREMPLIAYKPGIPWWRQDPRVHLPTKLPGFPDAAL